MRTIPKLLYWTFKNYKQFVEHNLISWMVPCNYFFNFIIKTLTLNYDVVKCPYIIKGSDLKFKELFLKRFLRLFVFF